MNNTAPQIDDAPIVTAPPARDTAPHRRALLIVAGIAALLLLLWLGDILPGIAPRQPYQATTRQAGKYALTLTLVPAQPKAGVEAQAQLRVTLAGKPTTGATVTYAWNMVTMDMGTVTGATLTTTTPGTYMARVTPLMGGYWRLTVTVHALGQPPGTAVFDIPVHG